MKQVNPDYIEKLKRTIRNSPYPRHMAMALADITFDTAEVTLDLAGFHLQPFGIVHGGVLATMIDTATFWSAFLRLPEDSGLVNVDLKLNYLLPVVGGQLIATGVCLRHGRSISYAEARVLDDKGQLVAHGTSTLMVLRGKGIDLQVAKFLK